METESTGAEVHLAQYNITRLRHPIGHPETASFEALIDETNARAEASPGFVWRHGIDSRDTEVTAYDDPLVLVNASVWESLGQLRDFAFRGFHRDVYRRRQEWIVDSAATMWWAPKGSVPSLDECRARLAFHHRHGSTPYAFGMGERLAQLVLRPHRPDDPVVVELFARLDAELVAAAPPDATNFLEIGEHHPDPDDGTLLIAWLDGTARGCGAWRRIDDACGRPATGELKRMWVDPAARGARLGAALLDALETAAVAQGISELRLETGRYLEGAMRLYEAAGFTECAPWGDYVGADHSYTMSKALDLTARRQWPPQP
jgi:GNAT superfamily N-acetyltransferase